MAVNLLLCGGVPADRFSSSIQFRPIRQPTATTDPLWRMSIADTVTARTPGTPAARPVTSAIPAGWACVALGLAAAWFFPPAHLFFSLGLIMAVIAMATHQVRAGLLLLAGTLVGTVLCVAVFLSLWVSPLLRPVSPVRAGFHAEPPRLHPPAFSPPAIVSIQPQSGVVGSNRFPATAARPLRLAEVKQMLEAGWSDAGIITAIAGRPRVEVMGQSDVTELRALGASNALIDQLGGSRLSAGSALAVPARAVAAPSALPVVSTPVPTSTTVDYAARDRRIASLNQQINSLDDQIRTIRNHPGDSRYQAATQTYLDQLDRQRNALRQDKWRLEGR